MGINLRDLPPVEQVETAPEPIAPESPPSPRPVEGMSLLDLPRREVPKSKRPSKTEIRGKRVTKSKVSDALGPRLNEFVSERPDGIQEYADRYPEWRPECPIKVLIGDVGGEKAKVWYESLGWGRMYSSSTPSPYPGEPWAFDNGAWAAWSAEEEVDLGDEDGREARIASRFPEEKFLERLETAYEIGEKISPPLLAVVPDILEEGRHSLPFSVEWMERLEEEGYGDWSWYLAVQGGMDMDEVEEVLPLFDGMFFGGGNELKPSARRWRSIASRVGVPFHYGQCGTPSKLQHAFELKVDSLDSAGPRKSRYLLREFLVYYKRFAELYYPELNGGPTG